MVDLENLRIFQDLTLFKFFFEVLSMQTIFWKLFLCEVTFIIII